MKTITSLLLTAAVAGSLFVGPFASAQTKPTAKPVAAKKTLKAHASKKTKSAKHAMKSSKSAAHSAPGGATGKK